MTVQNLVTNPSFETGTTGWTFTTATGSTLAISNGRGDGLGFLRSKGLRVTPSGGNPSTTYTVTGLTIGQRYTASFYVRLPSQNTASVVATIAGQSSSAAPINVWNQFERRYVGFIATATSHTLTIAALSAAIFVIDLVQVNEGGLLPYFDGSYPFTTWDGTADASTSTNTIFGPDVNLLTTDEVVVVNGLCLNTVAWSITSKTGRATLPASRGDDITPTGDNGKIFVPNKPIDTGLYTLSMFALGTNPDGTVPFGRSAQRIVLEQNIETIMRACVDTADTVTIYTWRPDASVRTTQATLIGSSSPLDATLNMAGRRAEFSLAFEVMPGVWEDAIAGTIDSSSGNFTTPSTDTLVLNYLAGGTAPITDAVITVNNVGNGSTVTCDKTGTSVTYTGTNVGTWVIDCGTWTSTLDGVSVSDVTVHSGHPRYLVLPPGDTVNPPTLSFSGGITGNDVTNLTIKRKFLTG